MPTNYNAGILQEYADDLYKQAQYIVITTAIRYGLLTFLVSVVVLGGLLAYISSQYRVTGSDLGSWSFLIILAVTAIGVAAGLSEGRRKAFMLKVKAQELLCQRQIEFNTRLALPADQSGKQP